MLLFYHEHLVQGRLNRLSDIHYNSLCNNIQDYECESLCLWNREPVRGEDSIRDDWYSNTYKWSLHIDLMTFQWIQHMATLVSTTVICKWHLL